MDILCVLHDSNEYGVCRWPLQDLQRAAGVTPRSIRELVEARVLKGSDTVVPELVFTPRHGRQWGPPATLISAGPGPCWYSARMVRDEHVRKRKGSLNRFTGEEETGGMESTNDSPNPAPMPPLGEGLGDGSSTSPSSSASTTPLPPRGNALHLGNLVGPEADEHQGKKVKEAKPPKPRERNPLLDALIVAEGGNPLETTRGAWSKAAKALAEIGKACPDVTAEEIDARAARYRRKNPKWTLTSMALANHWGELGDTADASSGMNPVFGRSA